MYRWRRIGNGEIQGDPGRVHDSRRAREKNEHYRPHLAIFMFGAAILHIKEIIIQNNFSKGNVVTILPDIVMPLTIIILLCLKEFIV